MAIVKKTTVDSSETILNNIEEIISIESSILKKSLDVHFMSNDNSYIYGNESLSSILKDVKASIDNISISDVVSRIKDLSNEIGTGFVIVAHYIHLSFKELKNPSIKYKTDTKEILDLVVTKKSMEAVLIAKKSLSNKHLPIMPGIKLDLEGIISVYEKMIKLISNFDKIAKDYLFTLESLDSNNDDVIAKNFPTKSEISSMKKHRDEIEKLFVSMFDSSTKDTIPLLKFIKPNKIVDDIDKVIKIAKYFRDENLDKRAELVAKLDQASKVTINNLILNKKLDKNKSEILSKYMLNMASYVRYVSMSQYLFNITLMIINIIPHSVNGDKFILDSKKEKLNKKIKKMLM